MTDPKSYRDHLLEVAESAYFATDPWEQAPWENVMDVVAVEVLRDLITYLERLDWGDAIHPTHSVESFADERGIDLDGDA